MTTLVLGADGMLGRAFKRSLERRGREARLTDRETLDLLDVSQVRAAVATRPSVVINCAAYTQVDQAEAEPELADAVNGQAVAQLAEACRSADVPLIHFSTDYVFGGDARRPYPVDAPREPVNAYGRSKALGEAALEASGARHLLIRTSWLYAPWGQNFLRTIARLSKEKPSLEVVDDQRGRPTDARVLAEAALELLAADAAGTFHVAERGECTWFDFASAIAAIANPECGVTPCSSDRFPRAAKRPPYSVLDTAATEAVVGPLREWRGALEETMGEVSRW